MHKLMEYICDELDELERKADKDGKLSMAEMQYVDMLAHAKKSLLTADAMMEEGYSMDGSYDGGSYGGSYEENGNRSYRRGGRNSMRSYARGRGRNARRDNMGRYSSDGYSMDSEEMVQQLREMMQEAPDDRTRQEFQRFIQKMETL